MYEDYHGADAAPRPAGPPARGRRDVASREQALQLFPIGTQIGREFADREGHLKVFEPPSSITAIPTGEWSTPTETGRNSPRER